MLDYLNKPEDLNHSTPGLGVGGLKDRVLQTDKGLNKQINRNGCNFRSLLAICETFCGCLLTAEQIMKCYDLAVNEYKAMLEDCSMTKYLHRIFNVFSMVTGEMIGGYQIGNIKIGYINYWNKKYFVWNASVLRYKTDVGDHYCEGDRNGMFRWNPDQRVELNGVKETILYWVFDPVRVNYD